MVKRLGLTLLCFIAVVLLSPVSLYANPSAQGWCEKGGIKVATGGLVSTTSVQASYPVCTVTVYLHGVTPPTLATLYSDDSASPTPLANPFAATSTGHWQFYANDGRYDVVLSGGGFSAPFTLSDIVISETTYLTSFGAKCDGSTDDTVAFITANSVLSMRGGGDLVIPQGKTCVIGTVTVSTNVNELHQTGGMLAITNGSTLTNYGTITAAPQQIFTGPGTVRFSTPVGGTVTIFSEWWGAANDGRVDNSVVTGTDSTTAIQAAITSVCGNGTTSATGSTLGTHGEFRFLPGMYLLTGTGITVPPSCYADIGGASAKGTYLYQTSGSGAAITIQGSFNAVTPTRTSSEFDANIVLHDLSVGSKVGHAISTLNAYRTMIQRVYAFSAGTSSNYFNFDGASVIRGDDLYVNGNDTFPGNLFTAPYGFTQGVNGFYITSTVNSFGYAGRYNISGEFFFTHLYCEGQQTGDCIYTYVPSGTDFSLFPVFVTGADIAITSGKAAYHQNGKAIAYLSNCYCERASSGTVDLIRIDSDQGNGTVYGTQNVGSTARLNFNGNGVNKPSLYSTNSQYSTFVSASGTYGNLSLIGNTFVTDTASAYSTWSGGDKTIMFGNSIGGGTGTATTSVLNLGIGQITSTSAQGNIDITPPIASTNIDVQVRPSTGASSAQFTAYGGSDKANSAFLRFGSSDTSSNRKAIQSSKTGTGTTEPFDVIIGSTIMTTVGTDGSLKLSSSSAGLVVGNATGGALGVGKINVSAGIYLNNSLYNNPDYVFEKYFTGRIEKFKKNPGASGYRGLTPISRLESELRKTNALSRVHEAKEMFERQDVLLEKLEEAYLYIIQLNKRVEILERTR